MIIRIKKKKKLTRTGDFPIGNGTGGICSGRRRRRFGGVVDDVLLGHGIAELESRQGVLELRNLVVAESTKTQIHTSLQLLQIVVGQALRPPKLVPFQLQQHPAVLLRVLILRFLLLRLKLEPRACSRQDRVLMFVSFFFRLLWVPDP